MLNQNRDISIVCEQGNVYNMLRLCLCGGSFVDIMIDNNALYPIRSLRNLALYIEINKQKFSSSLVSE